MAENERVVAQDETISVVTFFLGDEECGVPITDVHQIIRDTPITKVPNVNPNVEGVLNLRGRVVPITDLKHLLGLGTRILSEHHRLIIIETENRVVGFSVDSVVGVFQFARERLQAAPEVVLAKVDAEYIAGVVRRERSIVILLDIHAVFRGRVHAHGSESGAGVAPRVMPRTEKRF